MARAINRKTALVAVLIAVVAFVCIAAPSTALAADGLESLRKGVNHEVANRTTSFPAKKMLTKAKSSNKKILTVSVEEIDEESCLLNVKFKKKTGKAKVTYRIAGKKKKYTLKFETHKYENPVKTLKIGKKSYAAKFKKYNMIETNNALAGKLKVKAASGWKFVSAYAGGDFNGKDSKKVKSGSKLPKNRVGNIMLMFFNEETKVNDYVIIDSYSSKLTQETLDILGR